MSNTGNNSITTTWVRILPDTALVISNCSKMFCSTPVHNAPLCNVAVILAIPKKDAAWNLQIPRCSSRHYCTYANSKTSATQDTAYVPHTGHMPTHQQAEYAQRHRIPYYFSKVMETPRKSVLLHASPAGSGSQPHNKNGCRSLTQQEKGLIYVCLQHQNASKKTFTPTFRLL
jgi:hypothetical protein